MLASHIKSGLKKDYDKSYVIYSEDITQILRYHNKVMTNSPTKAIQQIKLIQMEAEKRAEKMKKN